MPALAVLHTTRGPLCENSMELDAAEQLGPLLGTQAPKLSTLFLKNLCTCRIQDRTEDYTYLYYFIVPVGTARDLLGSLRFNETEVRF